MTTNSDLDITTDGGTVTIRGHGWQIDVITATDTWRKPDGGADPQVLLIPAEGGGADGDGRDGMVISYCKVDAPGLRPISNDKTIKIHGPFGGGGGSGRKLPVIVGKGGQGAAGRASFVEVVV